MLRHKVQILESSNVDDLTAKVNNFLLELYIKDKMAERPIIHYQTEPNNNTGYRLRSVMIEYIEEE